MNDVGYDWIEEKRRKRCVVVEVVGQRGVKKLHGKRKKK